MLLLLLLPQPLLRSGEQEQRQMRRRFLLPAAGKSDAQLLQMAHAHARYETVTPDLMALSQELERMGGGSAG